MIYKTYYILIYIPVQLGEYIAAPSGFQTLFHGCELPIHRLIKEAEGDDCDSEGVPNEDGDSPEVAPEVQNEEKTENPSSLETES